MPRVDTRGRLLGTIRHSLRVERVRPRFTPLASLARLDLKKVAGTAKVDIELGHLSAGRCRQMVRATVRNGMVTGIEIDPCDRQKEQRPSRELLQLVRQAQRTALARARPRPFRPIPIARFMPQAARITIETIICFQICFFGLCITCCSTAAGQIVCGSGVVILPPIIIVF